MVGGKYDGSCVIDLASIFIGILMSLKSLLEQLFSEDVDLRSAQAPMASEQSSDLDEAAIAIAQARSEKLALNIQVGDEPSIILYKSAVILETLRSQEERGDRDIDETELARSGGFVGFVSFMEQHHEGVSMGYSINLAAAEHGYGPMLYDIALSVISPGYLMSDRNDVSKAAQKVWSYYFNNRSDVVKKLINGAEQLQNLGYLIPSSSEFSRDLGLNALVSSYHEIITKIDRLEYPRETALHGEEPKILSPEETERQIAILEADKVKIEEEYAKRIIRNPLAYMYKIKTKKSFVSLLNNHKAFCSSAPAQHSRRQLEEVLMTAGDEYARARVRGF